MDYKNLKLVFEMAKVQFGCSVWCSFFNFVIVKYWGKYGWQLLCNFFISFILDCVYIEMEVVYVFKKGVDWGIVFDFYFDGSFNEVFVKKVKVFLESIIEIFFFLNQLDWMICFMNFFFYFLGIVFLVLSMSVLALCLCIIEDEFFGMFSDDDVFW